VTQFQKNKAGLLNSSYLSLFVINLMISISFYMVSTTISLYVTGLGDSAAVAGTVVGVLSLASLCIRPFSGLLSDRHNRKKLLLISLTGICIAMASYGFTKSIATLIILRILHGISFSIATTVTLTMVADTLPPENMTEGMGYFAVGQTISSAIAPSLGLWLGDRYSYAMTFWFASGLIALSILLGAVIVKNEKQIIENREKKLTLKDIISIQALPYGVLATIAAGSTGIENGFISLYGSTLGLGNIGWYFTIGAAALFISRIGSGHLADSHTKGVMLLGLFLMTGAFMLLGINGTAVALGIAAALKAFGLGAVQPILQASSLKAVAPSQRGAASSTYYLGTDVGQALAPVLGGIAIANLGFRPMFRVFSLPTLFGMIFYIVISKKYTKGEE
jgi:MFS family permease